MSLRLQNDPGERGLMQSRLVSVCLRELKKAAWSAKGELAFIRLCLIEAGIDAKKVKTSHINSAKELVMAYDKLINDGEIAGRLIKS